MDLPLAGAVVNVMIPVFFAYVYAVVAAPFTVTSISVSGLSVSVKVLVEPSPLNVFESVPMMDWQRCHLGMVVPLADAIYRSGGDNYMAGKNSKIMLRAAKEIRRNLALLKQTGTSIQPAKMNLFIVISPKIVAIILAKLYCSDFGTRFIYEHSKKAKKEMMALRHDYYRILKERI